MYSQTIVITHGPNGSGGGGQTGRNGPGCHQNGTTSSEVLYSESYGRNSDNVRSFYKSRVTEKLYSEGIRATREDSKEVSCFVRSEIKWVFLKSLKVRQSVGRLVSGILCSESNPRSLKNIDGERLQIVSNSRQSSLDIKAPWN